MTCDRMEAICLNNPDFRKAVAQIMRAVPEEGGCVCVAKKALLKGVASLDRTLFFRDRDRVPEEVSCGKARKALLDCSAEIGPLPHTVGISAMCGNDVWFPRRLATRPGDRVYLLDFRHDWDVVNGRPGHLGRADEARRRLHAEMGFTPIAVSGATQLPFLG